MSVDARCRFPVAAVAAILAFALSCGGDKDSENSAGQLVAEWPADPEGVARKVAELPDPLARIAAVRALSEAYPGEVAALCESLPDDDTRDRCVRLNRRPHLRERPGGKPAPRPVAHAWPTGGDPVAAPEGLCEQADGRAACLDNTAADAAATGDDALADAICRLHPESKYIDECRFFAAETGVKQAGAVAYPAAVTLCGLAEPYSRNCWSHLLSWLPRSIPPPDAGPEVAADAVELARVVGDTWATADPTTGALQVQRFWSLWFGVSYLDSDSPDGSPLAWYPEESWPFVRAGLAMRMAEMGMLKGTLDQQRASLSAALARRSPPSTATGSAPRILSSRPLQQPSPEAPNAPFLGVAWRPLSDDADEDLELCLLGAVARTKQPDRAVLEEATQSDRPRVAAEARRLLTALDQTTPRR